MNLCNKPFLISLWQAQWLNVGVPLLWLTPYPFPFRLAWLFSFDIKSGYHHVDIFPPDQEFLGFSWSKDGVIRFYKYTVLPFGISTGPYIFTKVLRMMA